jgi:dihydroorotase
MTILLRQVKIADQHSPYNGQVKDILLQDAVLVSIQDHYEGKADQIVDYPGTIVSLGWVDPFTHFCDPGYEHRETLKTGAAAAQAGGFTTVFVVPNTQPVMDNKSQVNYIVQQQQHLPIEILPIGALSKKIEGKDLAEMIDMHQAGAVASSDGLYPVQSNLLFLKALQYVKTFDGVVIQMPIDKSMGAVGLMNEGITSTQIGLPGIPAIAEELMIARDIELLKYTNSKLHITGVSTAKGIALIEAGKKAGLALTCSVTPYHLYFNETDLNTYDTLLKVYPPLRTKVDQAALQDAVERGVVDCISSHHQPQDWDGKTIEFEYAKAGIACIETTYATINHLFPKLKDEAIANLLSNHTRQIFNLGSNTIKEGHKVDLTLFNRTNSFTPTKATSKSKSVNNPFLDKALNGTVIGTYSKGQLHLNKA